MKLNYSLTSGFASADGATPTRDNVSSWVAWAPVAVADIRADLTLGSMFYLAPRAIPQLTEGTLLLGLLVGEADMEFDTSLAPQQLSYTNGASVSIEASRPVGLEAVRVVAAKNGPTLRQARSAFVNVTGERQFHVMHELYER